MIRIVDQSIDRIDCIDSIDRVNPPLKAIKSHTYNTTSILLSIFFCCYSYIVICITLVLFVHTQACGNRIIVGFVFGVVWCVDCTGLQYNDIRVRDE